jgi:glutamate dehydrogenase/leucine dehydrogenase
MTINNTIAGLPYGGAKEGIKIYQNRKFKELLVFIQLLFIKKQFRSFS